jgi:hypothetical protein
MTDAQKIEFIVKLLQETANKTHCKDGDDYEDYDSADEWYNPADNGNFDDAFADGEICGEIEYARTILAKIQELN